jgi:hypothetical protein
LIIFSENTSPVFISFEPLPRQGVLNAILCDKVCQWLAAGPWFSTVSSTNESAIKYHNPILYSIHEFTIQNYDLENKIVIA